MQPTTSRRLRNGREAHSLHVAGGSVAMVTPADAPRHIVDKQLQASGGDRIYQSAGNQYVIERPLGQAPVAVTNTLPRDTAAFTGRAGEIERIMAAVTRATDRHEIIPVHAIDGMPGVGKTTLTVHAAHLLAERFPDGQLFLDLHAHTVGRGRVDPADALFALLSADGVHPDRIAP